MSLCCVIYILPFSSCLMMSKNKSSEWEELNNPKSLAIHNVSLNKTLNRILKIRDLWLWIILMNSLKRENTPLPSY